MNPAKNTIRPLFDNIVINDPEAGRIDERSPNGEAMSGGIIVPDSAAEALKEMALKASGGSKHYIVTALAVGDSCKVIKLGDRIVITQSGVIPVKVGDVSFFCTCERNVVAVIG